MSFDVTIRPGIPPVPAATARVSTDATQQTVQTELPEPQAVAAVPKPLPVRNDPTDEQQRLSRQIVYDRDAAEYIYQVVDQRNEVIHQFPDEARVRARTYFRELDQAKADERRLHTDRTA